MSEIVNVIFSLIFKFKRIKTQTHTTRINFNRVSVHLLCIQLNIYIHVYSELILFVCGNDMKFSWQALMM